MTQSIHPDVYATFRRHGRDEFVSRSISTGLMFGPPVASPVYIIARVVVDRVIPGAVLDLPAGCDNKTLRDYAITSGSYDRDVHVSRKEATNLADIGQQVLDLNERGAVLPPLREIEQQAVKYLITLVGQLSAE